MGVTTIIWVSVTFATQAESKEVLRSFYKKIQPGGPGWAKVVNEAASENIDLENKKEAWGVPSGILAMLLGCVMIYSCMFATGYWIYGENVKAVVLTVVAILSGFLLV